VHIFSKQQRGKVKSQNKIHPSNNNRNQWRKAKDRDRNKARIMIRERIISSLNHHHHHLTFSKDDISSNTHDNNSVNDDFEDKMVQNYRTITRTIIEKMKTKKKKKNQGTVHCLFCSK